MNRFRTEATHKRATEQLTRAAKKYLGKMPRKTPAQARRAIRSEVRGQTRGRRIGLGVSTAAVSIGGYTVSRGRRRNKRRRM